LAEQGYGGRSLPSLQSFGATADGARLRSKVSGLRRTKPAFAPKFLGYGGRSRVRYEGRMIEQYFGFFAVS